MSVLSTLYTKLIFPINHFMLFFQQFFTRIPFLEGDCFLYQSVTRIKKLGLLNSLVQKVSNKDLLRVF
jgi:hypothetical protein